MTEQATAHETDDLNDDDLNDDTPSPAEELALLKERAVQLGISFLPDGAWRLIDGPR